MDALAHRVGDRRRVRLGRADGRRHRRALARAVQGHGVGERLPDRQPGGQPGAACRRAPSSRGGTSSTSRPNAVEPATTSTATTSPSSSGTRRHRSGHFDDETFDRSAAAFDNPDHVDIVIHNYRWRLGLAPRRAAVRRPRAAARHRPGRSRCRRSPSKATPTVRRTRTRPRTQRSSPASTRTGPSPAASGTTCPKRHRRHSSRRSSTSTAFSTRSEHGFTRGGDAMDRGHSRS